MSPLLVAVYVALGLGALGIVLWIARRRPRDIDTTYAPEPERGTPRASQEAPPARDPSLPAMFGPKCLWLAVRSDDAARVAGQLPLSDPKAVTWAGGIDAAYRGGSTVFVTPAVDGWVLVVGTTERLAARERLLALSRAFGEAQHFMTHRGASCGSWHLARSGEVVRILDFGDSEISASEGSPTPVESELGLGANDPSEAPLLDEDEVFRVAGAWSIDPTTLEARDEPREPGLLGRLPA